MLLLGAGILFPYNVLITAVDYFDKLYPDENLEFFIPMVMNYPSPILQFLMIKYGRTMSFTRRIVFWFLLQSALLVTIPLVQGHMAHTANLWFLLTNIFVLGAGTAILQSSIFGFAGMLPPKFTQAIMSGNAVAGLVVSAARIITKAAFPDDVDGLKKSAMVYFALSAFTTTMCVLGYMAMLKLPFTQHYLQAHERTDTPGPSSIDASASLLSPATTSSSGVKRSPDSEFERRRVKDLTYSGVPVDEAGSAPDSADEWEAHPRETGIAPMIGHKTPPPRTSSSLPRAVQSPHHLSFRHFLHETLGGDYQPTLRTVDDEEEQSVIDEQLELAHIDYKHLLKRVLPNAVVVFSVFFMTFLVYPGVITELESHHVGSGWFAIILITEFNVFDLLGRSLPEYHIFFSPDNVWKPTAARFLLYPLFILCANPKVLSSDVWIYVLVAIFAFSNGYFASLAMMFGPADVEADEKEGAGYIMSFSLNFGILAGSHVALLMHHLKVGVPED